MANFGTCSLVTLGSDGTKVVRETPLNLNCQFFIICRQFHVFGFNSYTSGMVKLASAKICS